MAQAAWGTKRRCPSCGAPFYDLNREPAICPKCDAQYISAPRVPTRLFRGQAKVAPVPVIDETEFEEDEVLERDADTSDEGDETIVEADGEEDSDELRD